MNISMRMDEDLYSFFFVGKQAMRLLEELDIWRIVYCMGRLYPPFGAKEFGYWINLT
jgi:hypothetical protein